MAKLEHYYTKFEEGSIYHIYNRTVDKQPLFRNEDNYRFFIKKYDEYLSPVADTLAYCLLGNHFHILIRIRELQDLTTFEKLSNLSSSKTPHDIVSHQFRKFFQSYAMAFNKQHQRIGTLFQTPFKRALIDNDPYFTQIIYYIHANPQHHGLINDFRDWPWSSYHKILSDKTTKLQKQQVIEWFGNKNAFQQYHDQIIIPDNKIILEDD